MGIVIAFLLSICFGGYGPVGELPAAVTPSIVPGSAAKSAEKNKDNDDNEHLPSTSPKVTTVDLLKKENESKSCDKVLRRCERALEYSMACEKVSETTSDNCQNDSRYKKCSDICSFASEHDCAGDEIRDMNQRRRQCPRPRTTSADSKSSTEKIIISSQGSSAVEFPPAVDYNSDSTEGQSAAVAIPAQKDQPQEMTQHPHPVPVVAPLPPRRPTDLNTEVPVKKATTTDEAIGPKIVDQQLPAPPLQEPSVRSNNTIQFYIPEDSSTLPAAVGDATEKASSVAASLPSPDSVSFSKNSALGYPSSASSGESTHSGGGSSNVSAASPEGVGANKQGSSSVSTNVATSSSSLSPNGGIAPSFANGRYFRGQEMATGNYPRENSNLIAPSLPGFQQQYHRASGGRVYSRGGASGVPQLVQRYQAARVKKSSLENIFSSIKGRVMGSGQIRDVASAERNKEIGQGTHTVFEQVVQRTNRIELDHNGMIRNP